MQKHARFLGFLGLFPFAFIPLAIEMDRLALFVGVQYFAQYSAIILSFLGGVLWYHSLYVNESERLAYTAMLPSIVGWISLVFLPPFGTIVCLTVALVMLLIIEHKTTNMALWYRNMRVSLTSIVTGCHLVILWQIHQIG